MIDPHQPQDGSPARVIYDAFYAETAKRSTNRNWEASERAVVYVTACQVARDYGLNEPSMEEVMKAERLALGHTDYVSKWVHGLINSMRFDKVS